MRTFNESEKVQILKDVQRGIDWLKVEIKEDVEEIRDGNKPKLNRRKKKPVKKTKRVKKVTKKDSEKSTDVDVPPTNVDKSDNEKDK